MSSKKIVQFWLSAFVVALAAGASSPAKAVGNCSWAPLNGDSQYFPIVINDATADGRKKADSTPCGAKKGDNTPAPDRGTCFGYVQCDGLAAYPVYCPRVSGCFFTNKGATDCANSFAKASEPVTK